LYQEVGGRKIKVNVTESFLPNIDLSAPEAEPAFVDSQYKVYVGNLAKTVTTEVLKNFFSEKGEVLSATVSRVPGTPKSKGFGFVTFSSDEEVEAAVSTFNNTVSFFCTTIPPASLQLLPAYITSLDNKKQTAASKLHNYETQLGLTLPSFIVQMN
jgi:polyadenylate-binding protein